MVGFVRKNPDKRLLRAIYRAEKLPGTESLLSRAARLTLQRFRG
jgi:hypothetical protein